MRALFFILRTGIPWKALPSTFNVSASTVHRRFQEWVGDEVFFNFWKKMLAKYQQKNHHMMKWAASDAAISKAPLGGESVGKNPVDRGKCGTKRHLCVDQNGVIIGIAISGANKHDNSIVKKTVMSIPVKLPVLVVFAADSAYDSKETRSFLKERGFVPLITQNRRRSKNTKEKTTSRHRWIIERTHSHLNKWRGILIRWNKKVKNYAAAIQIAAAFYILRFL